MKAVYAVMMIMLISAVIAVLPDASFAQTAGSGACTSDPSTPEAGNQALLSEISIFIIDEVQDASQALFEGIAGNSAYVNAVRATMTLFILFYGIAFLFGIVPLAASQVFMRLVKFALIAAFLDPSVWEVFNDVVVRFFNQGSFEIIDAVLQIAINNSGGSLPSSPPAGTPTASDGTISPFWILDQLFAQLLQPEAIIQLISSATTGPFGIGMFLTMLIGGVAFLMTLVTALRIFAVSVVAKALLFGLAPIFFVFLLFERTKQIFVQWVNQILNFSLLPILLFTFMSFYIVLLENALSNMLNLEFCWDNLSATEGDTSGVSFWRANVDDGTGQLVSSSEWTWEGMTACIKNGGTNCPQFPFGIENLLIFFILAFMAFKFNDVVQQISNELSGVSLRLNELNRSQFGGGRIFGGGGR